MPSAGFHLSDHHLRYVSSLEWQWVLELTFHPHELETQSVHDAVKQLQHAITANVAGHRHFWIATTDKFGFQTVTILLFSDREPTRGQLVDALYELGTLRQPQLWRYPECDEYWSWVDELRMDGVATGGHGFQFPLHTSSDNRDARGTAA